MPEPCSPSISTTRGDARRRAQPSRDVTEEREHLVAHDPHDLLRRRQAAQDLFADGLRAHPLDERLDDPEVDVRFEQRETNLAKRGVDGRLVQPSFAAKRLEDVLQTGAERLQHTVHLPARSAGPGKRQGHWWR